MTDARWKQTLDFLRGAGLTKAGTDYANAYTLSIMRDVKMAVWRCMATRSRKPT